MTDNTKKTTVTSPIKGAFFSGVSQKIFGRVGEGYCSANSIVEVPVTNLIVSNIKSGVNVGGVVGTYNSEYSGTLSFSIYNASSSNHALIYDKTGLIFSGANNAGSRVTGTVSFVGNMIFIYSVNIKYGYGTGAVSLGMPLSYAMLFRIESNYPSIEVTN